MITKWYTLYGSNKKLDLEGEYVIFDQYYFSWSIVQIWLMNVQDRVSDSGIFCAQLHVPYPQEHFRFAFLWWLALNTSNPKLHLDSMMRSSLSCDYRVWNQVNVINHSDVQWYQTTQYKISFIPISVRTTINSADKKVKEWFIR